MFEPLRFLHVADVHLDGPLTDAGTLPARMRNLAMDATLKAFDQMVLGAIDHAVDFVLLAGNTFCEADQSLRARVWLLEGLRTLYEEGIEVFVLPGPADPEEAWRTIPGLPENVTLLTKGDSSEEEPATPVAVVREGRVLATITSGTLSQLSQGNHASSNLEFAAASANGKVRHLPFRVGLLTNWPAPVTDDAALKNRLSSCGCHYLAVPDTVGNSADGRIHYPGPLQALHPSQTGPHGASLIEVDNQGDVRHTFLPLASVRRVRLEFPVQSQNSTAQILDAMKSRLEKEPLVEGEDAWLIDWILKTSWQSSEIPSELIRSLPEFHPRDAELLFEHQIQFQQSPPFRAGEEEDEASELLRLYRQALESASADDACLKNTVVEIVERLENPNWAGRLKPLADEIDSAKVRSRALSLGQEWFRESRGS